jgi:hypothetical protein
MHRQWEQISTVRNGGRVEVVVPELAEGEVVKVGISSAEPVNATPPARARRPLGLLKGKIHMSDAFDQPLEEFEPYT